MATGAGLVELAKQHIGEDYEFVLVPRTMRIGVGRGIAQS